MKKALLLFITIMTMIGSICDIQKDIENKNFDCFVGTDLVMCVFIFIFMPVLCYKYFKKINGSNGKEEKRN